MPTVEIESCVDCGANPHDTCIGFMVDFDGKYRCVVCSGKARQKVLDFLWDGYVQCGFTYMKDRDMLLARPKGKGRDDFLYAFTACEDDGTPVMDVFYNFETGKQVEAKR